MPPRIHSVWVKTPDLDTICEISTWIASNLEGDFYDYSLPVIQSGTLQPTMCVHLKSETAASLLRMRWG